MNNINIFKKLYAKDKDDNEVRLVTSIYFPLGKNSGKDLTVSCGDIDEWRSIEDVDLIQDE
jgi:hypothetical protein